MEADMDLRDVLSKMEDTSSEPGDLPAQQIGEEPAAGRARGAVLWQVWVLGGALLGLVLGMFLASSLIHAEHHEE